MKLLAVTLVLACAAAPRAVAAQAIPVRSQMEAGAELAARSAIPPSTPAPMVPARQFSSRAPGAGLMIGGAAAVVAGILVGGGGGAVLIVGGVAAAAYGFYLYDR